jgi:Flp pilus assembly protein protease CpaA
MNITLVFIVVTVITVAVFDVWVMLKKGKSESVSAHLIRASHKYPSIPFIFGFIAGHLFWRMREVDVFLEALK